MKKSNDKCTAQESSEVSGGNVGIETATIIGGDKNTDQLIINAVRLRPGLWEPCSRKKTPSSVWDLWEKVCVEIGVERIQRDAVKDRWANLRKRYTNAYKTFTKYKESGKAAQGQEHQLLGSNCSEKQSAENTFISGYVYFKEMSFLSETVEVPE